MSDQTLYSPLECQAYAKLLERKHAAWLRDRSFEASVTLQGDDVYGTVTLRNPSGSFFYPVEGRIAGRAQGITHRDAGELLLDFIDSYFDEYFRSEGETLLPIDWADYEVDSRQLQVKGQIFDLVLEKLADDLIAGREIPEGVLASTRLAKMGRAKGGEERGLDSTLGK